MLAGLVLYLASEGRRGSINTWIQQPLWSAVSWHDIRVVIRYQQGGVGFYICSFKWRTHSIGMFTAGMCRADHWLGEICCATQRRAKRHRRLLKWGHRFGVKGSVCFKGTRVVQCVIHPRPKEQVLWMAILEGRAKKSLLSQLHNGVVHTHSDGSTVVVRRIN